MWHELIDHPEAWPETSSTAMFSFAMITGVKNGWLDRKPSAKAAHEGRLGLVSHLDSNADLRHVRQEAGRKNDLLYYLDRARLSVICLARRPVMWCAPAFMR